MDGAAAFASGLHAGDWARHKTRQRLLCVRAWARRPVRRRADRPYHRRPDFRAAAFDRRFAVFRGAVFLAEGFAADAGCFPTFTGCPVLMESMMASITVTPWTSSPPVTASARPPDAASAKRSSSARSVLTLGNVMACGAVFSRGFF